MDKSVAASATVNTVADVEMTLTVHLPRRRPRSVDLVVSWSGAQSADDLCVALAEHLAEPVRSLTSRGRRVPAGARLGVPPLVHGSSIAVLGPQHPAMGPPGTPPRPDAVTGPPSPRTSALEVAVTGGPDAGRCAPLDPPCLDVGRSPGVGLRVEDDAMSRLHATFRVTSAGVTVEDGSSTNGVVVDGRRTEGPTAVDTSSTIVVGASTLAVRRRAGAGLPVHGSGDGRLTIRPSRGPRPVEPAAIVTAPEDPGERRRTRVPWVASLVPIPVAGVLALVLGPQMLAFALLGPTVMLGSALADRWGAGREHREARAAHVAAATEARRALAAHLARECARRRDSRPDPHRVLRTAEHRLPGLWQHPSPQALRLGLGDLPAETTWVEGATRTHPTAPLVPVTIDLQGARRLGVVGDRTATDRFLGCLIGQLAVDVAPPLLRIGVASSDPSWSWARLLPHWWDPSDAVDAADADPATGRTTSVIVAPDPGSLEDGPWTRSMVDGALVIVAATSGAALTGGCAAVLTQHPGRWRLESGDGEVSVCPDLVGPWWVDRVARALAPLRVAVEQGSVRALPRSVGLAELSGIPEVTAEAVTASWTADPWADRATPRPPVAPVGLTPRGVLAIDLLRDGPHVLVGGTTGSGKSEFLRTLVTSLAVRCPPEDLTFVLVDFKGGSAFGSCARLPHVVGVVTDLDEHLVDRALRSLGSELRRRERVFAGAGARDLEDFQRRRAPDTEPVPRLVVVIDELRALVDELPDFVSGLVRLAALGRSLGVHLVLATQRPAGAVTAEVQANVNLRIAFRVRDRADSIDVIDDPGAASLPSDVPGRAMVRGGDGGVLTFQAASLSHSTAAAGPWLRVRRSREHSTSGHPQATTASRGCTTPVNLDSAGSGVAVARDGSWHASARDGAVDAAARGGSGEIVDPAASIVDAIVSAHSGRGGAAPRTPWPAPLPSAVGFSTVRGTRATGDPRDSGDPDEPGGEGQGVALLDQPDHQRITVLGPPRGTWLLSGPPGSGRTTAALAVALASATADPPGDLHLHVIESGGALHDLDGLPHLGTRLGARDHTAIRRLVHRLRAEVDRRLRTAEEDRTRARPPDILIVVDGWDQFVESQPDEDHGRVADDLVRVLRDGTSVGVRGLVTGGRSLLQPRWAGLGAELFLLGGVDALTAALSGVAHARAAQRPPTGQGGARRRSPAPPVRASGSGRRGLRRCRERDGPTHQAPAETASTAHGRAPFRHPCPPAHGAHRSRCAAPGRRGRRGRPVLRRPGFHRSAARRGGAPRLGSNHGPARPGGFGACRRPERGGPLAHPR